MPFLTDLDERARVKGSRDPLGYMATWAGFGRRIIGNLTTQTVSVRGFTTLLLGHWFAERVSDRLGADVASTLDVFLRFEQLAGYCRFHHNRDHTDFRGVRRVAARLQRGTRVTLGTAAENQILSNQRLYGLWGLYTVGARVSGFLEAEPVLARPGRELVETEYLPLLRRAGSNLEDQLIGRLAREGATVELEGRHAMLARAIARLLKPSFTASERALYTERLVCGGDLDRMRGLQERLAGQLRRLPDDTPFGVAELKSVIAAARRDGEEELADELDRIRRLEHVLAPSAYLFGFVLTRDRQPIDRIATEVRAAWEDGARLLSIEDVRELHEQLEVVTKDGATADRIVAIGEALVRADYPELVRLVLAQNAATMQARDGSQPWAVVENERLRVRLKDETGRLPSRGEVPTLWRHPYFISSLKMIQAELRPAA
jgi:hypothetical protein